MGFLLLRFGGVCKPPLISATLNQQYGGQKITIFL